MQARPVCLVPLEHIRTTLVPLHVFPVPLAQRLSLRHKKCAWIAYLDFSQAILGSNRALHALWGKVKLLMAKNLATYASLVLPPFCRARRVAHLVRLAATRPLLERAIVTCVLKEQPKQTKEVLVAIVAI